MRKQVRANTVVLAAVLLVSLKSGMALAEPVDTLIIIPEATGTAEKIYGQVVAGVKSNPLLGASVVAIPDDGDAAWLVSQIKRYRPRLVIPIGNKSYKLCYTVQQQSLPEGIQIVAGGISGKPNGIPTLSLTSSPIEAITQIKTLAPQVRDIHLVYSDDLNGWWVEQANEVAETFDIKIIGYRTNDLQQGVKLYSQMMKEANKNTSAIWIPLKSIVPSKTILPLVLEKAWAKKIPVISNNPSHTRLGSFMSLYPDHYAMGEQLSEFAIQHYKGLETKVIRGTNFLKTAINVRTSAHLGLRMDDAELERFDKVFPAMR